MTDLVIENMSNIFELLSQYSFTIVNDSDDFKCSICHKILANACQAICRCHYCKNCVDEFVKSGSSTYCPGNTEECKISTLSEAAIDDTMNKQILELVVKCPEEACEFESQLANIGDHLQICPKRTVDCPFNDVGCDRGKLLSEKLDDHLHENIHRHSEISIEAIGNLRNEVADLKKSRDKYKWEIDKFKKSDAENLSIIESMRKKINSMRLEKIMLERVVDNLRGVLDRRTVTSTGHTDDRVERERTQSVDSNISKTGDRVVVISVGNARENPVESADIVGQPIRRRTSFGNMGIIDTSGFTWTVDNLAARRKNAGDVCSAFFSVCMKEPYRMRLRNYIDESEMRIHLLIYAGNADASLRWPFMGRVTITVSNDIRPHARKSITRHCRIVKPTSHDSYRWSTPFRFKWAKLAADGIDEGDYVNVHCVVHGE